MNRQTIDSEEVSQNMFHGGINLVNSPSKNREFHFILFMESHVIFWKCIESLQEINWFNIV